VWSRVGVRRLTTVLAVPGLAALLLASCGSSDPLPTSAPLTNDGAKGFPAACTLASVDEVRQAMQAETVTVTSQNPAACVWSVVTGGETVELSLLLTTYKREAFDRERVRINAEVVDGLGEGAYWTTPAGGNLAVYKARLMLTITQRPPPHTSDRGRAMTLALATVAVARLG
jgi:hypothetical protein